MSRFLKIFSREFVELAGAVHIHTEYSHDSEVPLEKVIREARRASLDFLCITDHHTLQANEAEYERHPDNPMLIVGVEVNDTELNNHYLIFNTQNIYTRRPAREYMKLYSEEGAIGFIAHPREKRICKRYRKYDWTEPNMEAAAGLEIWNYVSSWVGNLKPTINGIFSALFPDCFVRRPLPESLALWDKMPDKAAIGSIDVHEHRINLLGLTIKILTHKQLYQRIRTYVLLPKDVLPTSQSVIDAMAKGNSYICNCHVGYPYNFYAGISGTSGEAVSGEEVPFCENQYLYFLLSQNARIALMRDGKEIARKHAQRGKFLIPGPGYYRLQITRFGRGWIYTNHIHVTK
ncbi:MAG: PHP domain-containing protein [Candidatus Cloacimonetes bacterium]|nr:PHP domain-containing protein [Candidatus Cloacimonadota bacterium]